MQGAAVQISVIYILCRIESNSSFPQLTSPHKNPTSVGVSAIPALFSALSSIISEHRPAWHLSILRESVSAACFLCCVPSPLRAFSAACYSSRCVLPLYLAACILHPSPHLQSHPILSYPQLPTHPNSCAREPGTHSPTSSSELEPHPVSSARKLTYHFGAHREGLACPPSTQPVLLTPSRHPSRRRDPTWTHPFLPCAARVPRLSIDSYP